MNNTRPDQALVGCRTNFMETLHYSKLAQPVARLKTSPRPVLRPPLRTGLLRLASAFSDPNESGLAVVESWFWGVRAVMNNPDHDTLVRAIDDVRRILGEYLEPGPRNATRTVERLLVVLDRNDVALALDRMKRHSGRLVE